MSNFEVRFQMRGNGVNEMRLNEGCICDAFSDVQYTHGVSCDYGFYMLKLIL